MSNDKTSQFELESGMKKLLKEFEAKTGLIVKDIEINRRQSYGVDVAGPGNDLDILGVRVSVAVRAE